MSQRIVTLAPFRKSALVVFSLGTRMTAGRERRVTEESNMCLSMCVCVSLCVCVCLSVCLE